MDITFEKIEFEKIGRTLYQKGNKFYRLFAHSVSPNRCWLVRPEMRELLDIDTNSGEDVYGSEIIKFEICGTVPGHHEFFTLD